MFSHVIKYNPKPFLQRSCRTLYPATRRNLFYPSITQRPPEAPFKVSKAPPSQSDKETMGLSKTLRNWAHRVPRPFQDIPEEAWSKLSDRAAQPNVQGGPYLGRTVEVVSEDNSVQSIRSAVARLNYIMRRENSVVRELNRTKRHEQKGEKRRRLHRERWRRKFNDEVRQRVQLVLRMNAQDRMWGLGH